MSPYREPSVPPEPSPKWKGWKVLRTELFDENAITQTPWFVLGFVLLIVWAGTATLVAFVLNDGAKRADRRLQDSVNGCYEVWVRHPASPVVRCPAGRRLEYVPEGFVCRCPQRN